MTIFYSFYFAIFSNYNFSQQKFNDVITNINVNKNAVQVQAILQDLVKAYLIKLLIRRAVIRFIKNTSRNYSNVQRIRSEFLVKINFYCRITKL